MELLIFIYIVSIILYYIFVIYQFKLQLKQGYEYNIIRFIGLFIIIPFIPFINTSLALVLIQMYMEENDIKKAFNNFLRKVFRVH